MQILKNNKKYFGKVLTCEANGLIILNYIKYTKCKKPKNQKTKNDEGKSNLNLGLSEPVTVRDRRKDCCEEHPRVSDRNEKSRLRRPRTVKSGEYGL